MHAVELRELKLTPDQAVNEPKAGELEQMPGAASPTEQDEKLGDKIKQLLQRQAISSTDCVTRYKEMLRKSEKEAQEWARLETELSRLVDSLQASIAGRDNVIKELTKEKEALVNTNRESDEKVRSLCKELDESRRQNVRYGKQIERTQNLQEENSRLRTDVKELTNEIERFKESREQMRKLLC
ncbi:8f6232f7-e084-4a3d-b181-29d6235edb5d [Sclerotinia trifoliorum]|uniref:8f6232f7-e084-4a3d-b181-29d6235edb5d n=1 Tax=Sclerotinia trifoliorum TaxID=28548 RepID=A0A8H2ZVM6_9HELO|nr:8f6232f7-e084-4a3d-b181-29d6235edb5d [Sclerotinia trifoliorum]